MNIFLKILLYILSVFIILNFVIFLVLFLTSPKKSIKDKYGHSTMTMVMGYTFLLLGINELIYGKKPYQPDAANLIYDKYF